MPIIVGCGQMKTALSQLVTDIKGMVMSQKRRNHGHWKAQMQSVYQSDRIERVQRTYEIIVPRAQAKKQSKKRKEKNSENISSPLLSSIFG